MCFNLNLVCFLKCFKAQNCHPSQTACWRLGPEHKGMKRSFRPTSLSRSAPAFTTPLLSSREALSTEFLPSYQKYSKAMQVKAADVSGCALGQRGRWPRSAQPCYFCSCVAFYPLSLLRILRAPERETVAVCVIVVLGAAAIGPLSRVF